MDGDLVFDRYVEHAILKLCRNEAHELVSEVPYPAGHSTSFRMWLVSTT